MMRRFEWLFPIHKYIRLRKEVVGLHVFLAVLSAVLVPTAGLIAPLLYVLVVASRGRRAPLPPGSTLTTVSGDLAFAHDFFARHWLMVVDFSVRVVVFLAVVGAFELVVALIFVRKRPGRRRPLCTWRTFKYVLLGGQTWMFLVLAVVGIVFLLGQLRLGPSSESDSLALVTVVATLLLTTLLVVSGATAVQAAQAVIVLWDDRPREQYDDPDSELTAPAVSIPVGRTTGVMRWFEWLFPICKYIRLRKEVGGLRVLVAVLLAVLVPTAVLIAPSLYDFVVASRSPLAGVRMGSTLTTVVRPAARVDLPIIKQFFVRCWRLVLRASLTVVVLLGVIGAFELVVALIFVRKRPGRRRSLCTWRTVKYVLLGGQTWMFLFLAVAGMLHMLERLRFSPPSESVETAFVTGIATLLLATLLVVSGATAVQAARAVIALQDDRRCEECGYFLIGLTTPRCPECGQPFDPAKLGKLAVGSGETGRDAS